MYHLLTYVLLNIIILIMGYGLYMVFFQRDSYHHWNRGLLLSISLISIALPPILLMLNNLTSDNQVSHIMIPEVVINGIQQMQQKEIGIKLTSPLLFVYGMGVLLGCIRLLRDFRFIRKIEQNASISYWNEIPVCLHPFNLAPFSLLGKMYIRKDEFKDVSKSILIHESIHIREKHSLDVMVLQLLQTLFWFNPMYFLIKRELQNIHEMICDTKSLVHIPETEYRIALLSYQLTQAGITITHSFNHLNLKRRLSVMKKRKSGKLGIKAFLFIPLFALSLAFVSAVLPNPMLVEESSVLPVNVPVNKLDATHQNPASDALSEQGDDEVVPPTFPGGNTAMAMFISQHIKYPESAKTKGIEGTVYVQFMIRKNGKVTKVKLIRGIPNNDAAAREMEAEALRVVELMPDWNPATKNGKAVKMEISLPVKYKLDN